ncbi:lecithin retinol acyltransferase family protein [Cupriavidus sp. USMAHM13]|uniref:lecithin retinol acyltransferase family protein n=1 Tax=Cupriavidus sp. USMAHM13 TaxID=1389192 RepID=UPI0009F561D3|nr:lecithin retinol acyltransferase family protein [Cupriavidus sp. USMAHM13]
MSDQRFDIGLEPAQQEAEKDLPLGAHLVIRRSGYVHHGICAGDGTVVHYIGFKGFLRRGPVELTTLAGFADGHGFTVEASSQNRYLGAEVVVRAVSRLGEDDYRFFSNNCEHFCTWYLSGTSHSTQVEQLKRQPWRAVLAVIGVCCSTRVRQGGERAGMGLLCHAWLAFTEAGTR